MGIGKQPKTRRPASLARSAWRKLVPLILGLLAIAGGFLFCQGKVLRVADGDTVDVLIGGKREKVRLYGIDAPESAQAGGREAADFAAKFLLFETVSLSVVDRDQYGRSVALVRLEDGGIANEEMVRAGHAWVYRNHCREAFCAQWLALEYQAKKAGLGLWRRGKPVPPWQWRRNNPRR